MSSHGLRSGAECTWIGNAYDLVSAATTRVLIDRVAHFGKRKRFAIVSPTASPGVQALRRSRINMAVGSQGDHDAVPCNV